MSVERRDPGTALIAEVFRDEAKGAGELFVSLLWLNVAVDFNFPLSEVTSELTLRGDASRRQLEER